MPQLKVGDTIYHESRYWAQYPVFDEEPGWNARYLRYEVTRITPARIYATRIGNDNQITRVQLPRTLKHTPGHAKLTTLEVDGKQYHSRFHEYFYTQIPTKEWELKRSPMLPKVARALSTLGLPQQPYTPDVVNRAYKRMARDLHPDAGGSHEAFVQLKDARDVALRGY